ncbi:uncharacterized protein LOC124637105 [Helicoverpa zea]|uniref:uncharacterized protein LOC124637105 n=1 Tax=Helicoverpa zea TaxID=7113 RepID=UPI001F59194A|nr:uncharacterized protein LOC124637105 [Helicoverpa zea]
MDGSTVDHSDSDSGESWTLLEHSPSYGEDAPEFAENSPTLEQVRAETHIEKDEDTDGISVISDSEPESTPCELNYDKCIDEESRPTDILNTQFVSINPLAPNINDQHESIRNEDDFLGDATGKHKTYVHRRNKRLSTVLNIIMLGSVITAAGVAIGHMWGARNECSLHTTPSINKILSNLYKLQEENAYLRNKLKELTLVSSIQMQQKKLNVERIPYKQQRCKKVYEEPLNSKNTEKITKCIDVENNNFENNVNTPMNVIQPEYEKEFLNDIDKLRNIYQQNKSWLDDEVAKRMKNEKQTIKKIVNNMKTPLTSIKEEQKVSQDESVKKNADFPGHTNKLNSEDDAELIELELHPIADDVAVTQLPAAQKVTYADSLKSVHKVEKRDTNVNVGPHREVKEHVIRRKNKKDLDVHDVLSEEDLKKDDRYAGPKMKQDKKKRDRQKIHKKQKRRNKYEQWEMKGGYLKDYDEFSITSSQENEYILKKPDQNTFSRDFEKRNYINQFSDISESQNNSDNANEKQSRFDKGKKNGKDDLNWYDKRGVLRTEARKKLEHELFGETSPNNAGWYFRRMQRREQCRAKGDNSTYKKLARRNMNFKMKH